MTEIETLTIELIHELGKMTIEELQQLRPEMMEEMDRAGHLHPNSKRFLNAAFDLVIQNKQEKAAAIA